MASSACSSVIIRFISDTVVVDKSEMESPRQQYFHFQCQAATGDVDVDDGQIDKTRSWRSSCVLRLR